MSNRRCQEMIPVGITYPSGCISARGSQCNWDGNYVR